MGVGGFEGGGEGGGGSGGWEGVRNPYHVNKKMPAKRSDLYFMTPCKVRLNFVAHIFLVLL